MLYMVPDIIRYSFKALTERRLRAVLTIVGIAIGPLALVMITSVVQGHTHYVQQQLLALGQNTIVLFSTSKYTLKEDDLDFIKRMSEVDMAGPFYLTQAYVSTPEKKLQVYVYAIDMDLLFKVIGGLKVKEGDVPSPSEITCALIGYYVSQSESTGTKYYDVGDAVPIVLTKVESGGEVKISRTSVRVKGILAEYGGAMILSPDKAIFLPPDSGNKILHMRTWSGIIIILKSPTYVSAVVNKLRDTYGDNIDIISFKGIAQIVGSVSGAMNFITFATSLSAFAVAVAGTAATMITSVIERTREIGVLKALGFTDGQVMAMILAEALLMSLIGAAIGISLGIAGAHLLASGGFVIKGATANIVIRAPPMITPELILRTLGITIMVGILGGVFPAQRAAKIPPAVALRYE